jgi:hypothetical protein
MLKIYTGKHWLKAVKNAIEILTREEAENFSLRGGCL